MEDDHEAMHTMLQTVIRQLKPRKAIPDLESDVARPGSFYPRYRTESDLPETARSFYETAAKVAGISLSTLVRAVSQTEAKLSRWLDDQRRTEYHRDSMEMDINDDASTDDMEAIGAQDMSDSSDEQ